MNGRGERRKEAGNKKKTDVRQGGSYEEIQDNDKGF